MTILTRAKIIHRQSDSKHPIFSSGYSEAGLDLASYNMAISQTDLAIEGKHYNGNQRYPLQDGAIVLPPYRISVLTTDEVLDMPNDLCGRVGIRFSFSKEGLIPLFGPQIDPCYQGPFRAIVYNLSSEPIEIGRGDRPLKLELTCLEESVEVADKDRPGAA